MQGFHQARESFGRVQSYSGMIDCFKVIAKEEGATGFFKGLAPSTLKVLYLSFLIPWILSGQCLSWFNCKLENQLEVKDEKVPQKKYKIFTQFNQFAPQPPVTALVDPVLKDKNNFVI